MTSQPPTEFPASFAQNYERLLKRLKLRGMQPKTIESYSHGVRRAGAHFDYQIDHLSKDQLTISVNHRTPQTCCTQQVRLNSL